MRLKTGVPPGPVRPRRLAGRRLGRRDRRHLLRPAIRLPRILRRRRRPELPGDPGRNALPGVDPGHRALATCCPSCRPPSRGPAPTFTYADPLERPRPYYRLVLTFDPALDYGSNSVAPALRRVQAGPAGRVLRLCRLLSERPGAVGNDRLDVGHRARPIRASASCSANCSWSCSAIRRCCGRRSAAAIGVSRLLGARKLRGASSPLSDRFVHHQ